MRSTYFVVAVILVTAGSGHGQNASARQRYQSVSEEMKAIERDPRSEQVRSAKIEEATVELRDMVNAAIVSSLSQPDVSSASIQRALIELQGEHSLAAFLSETRIPFADVAGLYGAPTLVAAFAVMRGNEGIPDLRAYLHFYSRVTGVWELRSEKGPEFDGRAFSVSSIHSPISNEVWYLAWGRVIGDTGARLRIRLFGFDGWTVWTVWERDDLRGGGVKVISPDEIRLEYYEFPPPGVLTPPREVVEILHPTAAGFGP